MKIRNYKPEIRAVLSALIAEGFSIAYVDDGEDSSVPASLDVAVETVASVDVATAGITHPDAIGKRFTLLFILGNDPGEIVADWSYPKDHPISDRLETTLCRVADEWEGRPQPMEERE